MSINNKRAYTEYTVTQPTIDFAIGFDDFDEGGKDNILVTLNGVLVESLGYAALRKNKQTVTVTPAISEGTVRLTRETDIDEPFHKFTAGALFSAKSMDENFQQVRHSQQEVRDGFVFLEYNTNGIVQASKVATAEAKAATVEATASAVRAETAADTAVQAVGSLQGVVNAATTATTNANTATATANTAASQATAATTSAQNAALAATVAKQEATAATATANAAIVDTLAATSRANSAADVVADLIIGKVRAQDVSTADGSTQAVKNTEFRNELDALPFDNGTLADTFVTVTHQAPFAVTRVLHDKLQDVLTTRDFGGIGDGAHHPLSERFTTLGKAQEVYPFATSLSQQIDTAALQSQANNIPERNIINVGAGKYIGGFDTKSSVVGQGYATEIKVPTGGYGVKVKQFIPNWERACIQKLSISGNGSYFASHDGFGTGVLYDPDDSGAGRWNLDYVGIRNVEIGIHKPVGGIANNFFSVSVEGASYGYRAKSTDSLTTDHTGNDSFRECHFRFIKKWCIDIDTVHNGWGALTIDNCIFEGCVGGGIRINTHNQTSYQPITLRSLWFEQLATAETVMHDGVAEIPRQIKLIDVPVLRVEDSYLFNVELINSQMITDNCRIDTAALNGVKLVLDASSSITCDNFNYGGTVTQVPLIRSIASARPQWGQSNSLRGELTKGAVVDASAWNGRVLVANTFTGEVGVTTYDTLFTANRGSFTTASVDDGAHKTGAMEITLETSSEVTMTKSINFVEGKWYVWNIEGKFSGGNGVSQFNDTTALGDIYWHKGGWTASFGIAKCTAASVSKPIYLTTFGGEKLKVRLQNYFICEFDNECDALAFANSRKYISKAV